MNLRKKGKAGKIVIAQAMKPDRFQFKFQSKLKVIIEKETSTARPVRVNRLPVTCTAIGLVSSRRER